MAADSFLVYPKDALGTNYIYMLYPPKHPKSRHLLTVVATEGGHTSVEVSFPATFTTSSFIYDSAFYDKGL